MKKHIPNFVTLLNLFCGSIAVIFAVHNNFVATAFFVFLGIFFDFFDGFLARKLEVQSALGIQLDSLADMVTSGLVPGIVMFKLLATSADATSQVATLDDWTTNSAFSIGIPLIALLGLCITLASCYRLATFNIDEDQQTFFKGLPTPANALLVLSLPLIVEFQHSNFATNLILNPYFLVGFTLLSCYLLNSKIKLFALKFQDYSWANNQLIYILMLSAVILLVLFQFMAIPLIIILYILLSLIKN